MTTTWGVLLTCLSDTKNLTQDECELDAAPGEWTLVFILPAAVLQNKLLERKEKKTSNKSNDKKSLKNK